MDTDQLVSVIGSINDLHYGCLRQHTVAPGHYPFWARRVDLQVLDDYKFGKARLTKDGRK